jgi:transcriptional regulator with XRE-family HTH domain
MLSLLLKEANISQNELGKRSTEHRSYLVSNGHIPSESDTGSVSQSGISRIINGEYPPSYSQVYIWLSVLRKVFESDDYQTLCATAGKEVYEFTEEFEVDMWHLALFGAPKEVVAAYHRHKWLLKQN